MTTGEKIRYERKKMGLNQEELGQKMGVSLKTIQRWENDERSPRLTQFMTLAKVFGIMPNYLFSKEEDEEKVDSMISEEVKTASQKSMENIATITLRGGESVQAPATPEGYAFLERLFLASLKTPVTQGAMA